MVADEQQFSGDDGAEDPDGRTPVSRDGTAARGGQGVAHVAARPRGRRRVRAAFVGVLVALTCLSVVVTGLTFWSHYTVMGTEGYMSLVGPIGKDPQAIQRLSEFVGDEVISATDIQKRISDALPERVRLLAGPITAYVEEFIVEGARKILSSPKAYELWLAVNRTGHEKVVALLRGDRTDLYIEGSDVRLNLLPLISRVLVWLDERLPGGLSDRFSPPVIDPGASPEDGIQDVANWSGKPLPSDFGQITLLQSDALGPAQRVVAWFDRLTWILPLVIAAFVAITIGLSRRRARTAIAIGVGTAVAVFVTRVIIRRTSLYLTDQVREGEGRHIVRGVVDAALGPLTTMTIWICVAGVLVAVSVWLLGRQDVREAAVAAGRLAVGRAATAGVPDSRAVSWVTGHVVGVRWAALVVGLIVLSMTSTWLGIVSTIVIVILVEGILSLIAGQWPFHAREGDGSSSG